MRWPSRRGGAEVVALLLCECTSRMGWKKGEGKALRATRGAYSRLERVKVLLRKLAALSTNVHALQTQDILFRSCTD